MSSNTSIDAEQTGLRKKENKKRGNPHITLSRGTISKILPQNLWLWTNPLVERQWADKMCNTQRKRIQEGIVAHTVGCIQSRKRHRSAWKQFRVLLPTSHNSKGFGHRTATQSWFEHINTFHLSSFPFQEEILTFPRQKRSKQRIEQLARKPLRVSASVFLLYFPSSVSDSKELIK